ncbi:CHAT domain-containing protein [Pseudanabaena sp. FACHB-1998]|uniref:CHAT domain-containing protein n=1 Tax=Pseudanabaena sp. FACHB-1998 TaxID=2692858 RepID=UPI0016807C92|nr:CHAT domain-containing protein [Pseudanabaena sp. FACHB-1998]MBD2175515.1 CHAT domain-containing protein [Pseudanabaena sp. FACHB-1998]
MNTNVNQIDRQYNITGGTQAGANLFYSLQKLGLTTGEIANFISNPNVQNILTRVTGGESSLINGLIQVTGGNSNLFILNPAGIVFGANASLNLPANFSATTATGIQVGNGWFGVNSSVDEVRQLTGNITGYGFTTPSPSLDNNNSGVILNQGNLSTNAGQSVTLVGGKVVNTGTIATPSGNITIATTSDNKFIKITNEGNVLSYELPISDRQALGNATVLRGVDLPSLLTGKNAGTTVISGNLDVSGDKGGNVQVLGNDVSLVSANINASGINGGGKVLIGGDLQGVGTTPKSLFTSVDANSKINADALVSGNGGQVIVWSDGSTVFDGNISAKAGALSGDGGLVETSGKVNLSIGSNAQVDTSALNGLTGTWLLDPVNLVVVNFGGTSPIVDGTNSVADSTINNSTIVAALNITNVNLTATNSISVNAVIDARGNANARNLTLNAPIANLNAPIALRTGGVLSGTATTVNLGANAVIQNGLDVAARNGIINSAIPNLPNSRVSISKEFASTILNIFYSNKDINQNQKQIIATISPSQILPSLISGKFSTQNLNQAFSIAKVALSTSQRDQATQFIRGGKLQEAIANLELSRISEIEAFIGRPILTSLLNVRPDPSLTREELSRVSEITGSSTALFYPLILSDRLEILVFFPSGNILQKTVNDVPREAIQALISDFRANLLDAGSNDYLNEAQKLHSWLIKPVEAGLDAEKIGTIVFVMDGVLRSIPPAALHDGKKFLIEKYAVASVPSLRLAKLEERDRRNSQVLAMGLTESVQGFSALPSVDVEINNIVGRNNAPSLLNGDSFLNKQFTVDNLQTQRQKKNYGIIHLATHAQFLSNSADGAFIQFYNDRLNLRQIPQLSLDNPQVEMLTLSACQTAVGNNLGLGGLAVTSGVRSVLASLWTVSDAGTVPLMLGFYSRFSDAPSKAIALQKAQLAIIKGEVKIDKDKIIGIPSLPSVSLPENSPTNIIHPYFWSSFMLVGSWL